MSDAFPDRWARIPPPDVDRLALLESFSASAANAESRATLNECLDATETHVDTELKELVLCIFC